MGICRGIYFLAILIVLSTATQAFARTPDLCPSLLELIGKPTFVERMLQIDRFKDKIFGFGPRTRSHRLHVLQNFSANQVVLLLGESHVKTTLQSETIERLTIDFSDIAIEIPASRLVAFKELALTTSNIDRALRLDPIKHRIHAIDSESPRSMHSSTAELSSLKLTALYLDALLGLGLHFAGLFSLGKLLPFTRVYVNERNIFMAENILKIRSAADEKPRQLLVIVGIGHLPQIKYELQKKGFKDIPLRFFSRTKNFAPASQQAQTGKI